MSSIKNKKWFRPLILLLIVFVIIGGGRKLMMNKKAALAKSPKFQINAKPLDLTTAKRGDLKEGFQYLAVVAPWQTSNISARVTARVDKVLHREGDMVKKGEVLATLDIRQVNDSIAVVQAQIQQTKAQKAAVKATLVSLKQSVTYWKTEKNRNDKLAKKGAASQSKALASNDKFNEFTGKVLNTENQAIAIKQQTLTLQRRADELKTTLEYYTLKSPFDGVISERLMDVGDLASPGKPIFTVEDRSATRLIFSVPQSDIPLIKKEGAVSFDYQDQHFEALINRVYPKLNKARMLRVEAVLNGKNKKELPLGAYLNIYVTATHHTDVILIPVQALIKSHDQSEVCIVEKGILHRRTVKVLGTTCDTAAVDGIKKGEKVLLTSFLGWAHLVEGMKVEAK